jgi:hypothetical protein
MSNVSRCGPLRKSRLVPILAIVALAMTMIPMLGPSPAAAANVNISLTKTVCPEGFDADSATLDELIANCVTPGAGFPFSVVPDGADPIPASADEGGIVNWTGLPEGSGIVAETAAENNTSRVFCGVYSTGGELPGSYSEYDATNNTIGYSLADNESLDCYWFNVPLADIAGDSTVNVRKLACPEGYDYAAASELDDLLESCVGPLEGVEFLLYPSDSAERTAITDAAGVGSFDSIPAGPLNLVETPPEGYQVATVYCASGSIEEGGDGVYDEMTLTEGGIIGFDLEPASYLECFWFNTPATPEESVNLVSLGCPEGYDWTSAGFETLVEDCATPLEDVEFTLDDIVAPKEGVTDADAFLSFQVGPGDYALTQDRPEEYTETRVYCTLYPIAEGRGEYTEYDIEEGSIEFSLEAGESINCRWFNRSVSGDPGPASLTINKHTCPAEFDVLAEDADPAASCTLPTEDITFTLQGDTMQLSASTGSGGAPATISFGDLEAGTYLLSEQIDESIAMAFVLECDSDARTFNYPFSPFAVIEPNGRLTVQLLAGEDLVCDWHNVLAPEPGTVTIVKYWCDGEAGDLTNCELYAGGAGFTLIPSDGSEEISLVTGEDGAATVEAEGTYTLAEDDFAWCGAESDTVDPEGNLQVNGGDEVTIEIFNCGPRPLQ